jgi:hypothetical protein
MKRILILALATMIIATPALAGVFSGSELLIGRTVKPPSSSKLISFGLDVQFAPLNMLLSSQKDKIIAEGISQACANAADPAACEVVVAENADLAMTTLAEVSDDEWAAIEGNLTNAAELDKSLQEAGIDDPAARQAVQDYVDQVPVDDRQGAVALSRTLANNEATAFMVEPNATLNLSAAALSIYVPMALYLMENETTFNMGNVTLDAKFGGVFGAGVAGFAISGGLSVYLPTGTEEADALGVSNLFYAPKFFHRYLSLAPYLVMGVDTFIVSLQTHGEVVTQIPVRDGMEGQSDDSVIYGKYGAGLIFFPRFLLSVIGEINGVFPISNADLYDATFVSGGVQLKVFWLKASVAAQFPIRKPAQESMEIGGVDLGQVADFTILGRVMFSF